MAKLIFFIILIILVVCGGLAIVYFTYEKPAQEQQIKYYVNLTISANEIGSDKYIETGYIIESPGITEKGKTLANGIIYTKFPSNISLKVYNENLEGQNYYHTEIERTKLDNEPIRIKLELVKPGNLTVTHKTDIFSDSVTINVSSDGLFKNLHMCAMWSVHIITLRTDLISIDVPDEMSKNVEKCYDLNRSLNNNSMEFKIDYKYFDVLDQRDYLSFYFYDTDCVSGVCSAFDRKNNTYVDIGGKNLIYTIKDMENSHIVL